MGRRSEDALVFMAKWPEPGRAKTRLCPPLSLEDAARFARCSLLDTLDVAAAAGADRFLAFAPTGAKQRFADLVGPAVELIPADGAHLGVSLWTAQRQALALGYRRVALVASDIPHLPAERYAEAWAALDGADLAIGPSGDGGYYLLAARCPAPRLFDDVAWSTEVVYEQTLARAAESGLRVATIAGCDDVDTGDDLAELHAALRLQPGGGRTLRLLDEPAVMRGVTAAG